MRRRAGATDRQARADVWERSGGICERCRESRATEAHHRVTRARGGPDHPANLAALCSACHRHAHAENERPWLADGRFIRGVYLGTDMHLTALFGTDTEGQADDGLE